MGSEFEFYLLTADTHEPLFDGYQIFNTVRNDYVPTIRRIVEEMPRVGVDVITANCEYAGSQWEINFAPGRGLDGPDHAFTFKNGVKEIAKQDGYLATFMSKPFATSAGSGCHTHLSLLHADSGGERVRRRGRSERHERHRAFVHRRPPHVRARDRRGDRAHRELPPPPPAAHVQPDERFLGIRGSLGADPGQGREPRLQAHRVPGALGALEPYLVGAAVIQAGLRGIEDKLTAPEPSEPGVPAEEDDSLEKLPTDLSESLDLLEAEPATRDFFGGEFITAYTRMRRYELSRLADHVSDWERTEYLELF
jgi:glutamine synthetase